METELGKAIRESGRITAQDAIALLYEEANKKGFDYVYDAIEGCQNFLRDGTPSCIVGHVYDALGFTRPEISEGTVFASIESVEGAGVVVEPAAKIAFRVAQSRQDGGATWGEAFESARAAGHAVHDAFVLGAVTV